MAMIVKFRWKLNKQLWEDFLYQNSFISVHSGKKMSSTIFNGHSNQCPLFITIFRFYTISLTVQFRLFFFYSI